MKKMLILASLLMVACTQVELEQDVEAPVDSTQVACTLSLVKEEIVFDEPYEDSENAYFYASGNWTAEVTEGSRWLSITPSSGEGSEAKQKVKIKVKENESEKKREGEIVFTMEGAVDQVLAVVQSGTEESSESNDGGGGDADDDADGDNENNGLNNNLTFTLELESVTATSARFFISHNGSDEDTWFGFATTKTNPLNAIEELVTEELAKTSTVSLEKGVYATYTLTNLAPETEYTFIVVGLTGDGTLYGCPNSIGFKTSNDYTTLVEIRDRWQLSYERIADGQGNKYEGITIECADDDHYYFDYFSEYEVLDSDSGELLIEECADYVANRLIPEYIAAGYAYDQFTYVGGGTLFIPRVESGKYYAFVIGMTKEGVHDGSYTVFEFTVLEEAATPGYEQWFGTYQMTAVNGVSYVLDIQHYDNNFMYVATGWECGEELEEDKNNDGYPDGMDFGTAFGDWVPAFPLYFNDGKLEFREYVLTNTSVYNEMNQEVPCFFGFYGYVLTSDGQLRITLTDQESPLAIASTTDGAVTATVAACESLDDKNNMVEINSLSYAAIAQDYSDIFVWNQPAELPFTMTKITGRTVPRVQKMSFSKSPAKPIFKNKSQGVCVQNQFVENTLRPFRIYDMKKQ